MLPADSAWLALERPENPMIITVMLRVQGLTAPRFREFLAVYWSAWERFRYQPVRRTAGWYWQRDPDFDPLRHLEVVIDRFTSDQLRSWVSARLNEPLPLFRPSWKFWLAPNAEGGAALVLRMHHCYADGLSLRGLFDRLCPASPRQPPALYGAPERDGFGRWLGAAEGWLSSLASAVGDNVGDGALAEALGRAGHTLGLWRRAGVRLTHDFTGLLVEAEDTPSPLRRPLLGRRQCHWSAPVPLARLWGIARTTRTAINDVLLSCVTAALAPRLGLTRGARHRACLHAAVPVDLRQRLPAELCPEPGNLGNGFGTLFVPLPVDGESPLERLYRIKQETRRLKASTQPLVAWGLSACAPLLPDSLRSPVVDAFCRKASLVVSNVPGTAEPRYLAGCRVTEQMFWVPQAGAQGLGLGIVSYAGQVQFGVVADEALNLELEGFLQDCLHELDRLEAGG
jgi:WS/DGAT/MGAT family acyltransferase